MEKNLKIFENQDFGNVRIVEIKGNPWFVGRDVALALGYSNASDAMNRHCKGIVKRYTLQTAGGTQEIRIINEPDLYRLVAGSKLPGAVKFEAWIFEEVLPSIRKTGAYSAYADAVDRLNGTQMMAIFKMTKSGLITKEQMAELLGLSSVDQEIYKSKVFKAAYAAASAQAYREESKKNPPKGDFF